MFISVLLPLPELPMIATKSPRSIAQRDARAARAPGPRPVVGLGRVAQVDHPTAARRRRDAARAPAGASAPPAPDDRRARRAAGGVAISRRREEAPAAAAAAAEAGAAAAEAAGDRRASRRCPSRPAVARRVAIGIATSSPAVRPARSASRVPTSPVMTGVTTILPLLRRSPSSSCRGADRRALTVTASVGLGDDDRRGGRHAGASRLEPWSSSSVTS